MTRLIAIGVLACAIGSTPAFAQSGGTFRTGIDVVSFGVSIMDKQGTAVDGLTIKDFELFENGRKQELKYFAVGKDSKEYGKGTVQSVNPLKPYMQLYAKGVTNDPGALKITIKKFYRASGASTKLKGVTPDIVLPSIFNDSKDFGESSLENPLPWDTIKSSKYQNLNRVEPYLVELRKQSTDRITTDTDFSYIREDIEVIKKQQADKTVSLFEKQLLQEKQEADARKKLRDKERHARKDPQEKVYEISLKMADKPGLPPPVEKTNTLAKASSRDLTAGSTNLAQAAPPRLQQEMIRTMRRRSRWPLIL